MPLHRRQRFPRSLLAPLALAVWLSSGGILRGEDSHHHAAALAAKVDKEAQRSKEKAGQHDLVPDTVRTNINAAGAEVIEQVGEASFYGKRFQGKKTASGKKFHQRKRTAAHRTLPLGTHAAVTNLETGKSTEVKITDRGPYAKGRDLDLSRQAAKEIGLTKKEGEAPVKIEALVPAEGEQAAAEATDGAKETERQGQEAPALEGQPS